MLVVGRTTPIAGVLEKFIGNPGWEIDYVPDSDAAERRLGKTGYDVVLVNFLSNSVADVTSSIRTLRAAQPGVKLILFVEQATTAQVVAAIRAHAFSFFSYPFNIADAWHMIATAAKLSNWTDGIEVLSAAPDYLTLRLRCALDTADRLLQFMKEVPVELLPEEAQETAQAFRELLLNAIEHGGKLNPEECVQVSRVRTRRTLVYYIEDPGDGFCKSDLPHAAISNPDNPLLHVQVREEAGVRPGGFGMLIATRLVDEVIYNEQGNHVILIKYLD
jgi:anti-sigma regulatory factor (Ser/Thr protein kinase)